MTLEFFVPGDPVSQTRPRVFRAKGGGVRTVSSSPSCANWRETVKLVALTRRPDEPIPDPLTMSLIFVFDRPPGHYNTKGDLSAEGRRHPRPTGRKDWDNLAKAVTDALEGVIYRNDAQIVGCLVEKRWASGTGPGCFVTLRFDNEPQAAPDAHTAPRTRREGRGGGNDARKTRKAQGTLDGVNG